MIVRSITEKPDPLARLSFVFSVKFRLNLAKTLHEGDFPAQCRTPLTPVARVRLPYALRRLTVRITGATPVSASARSAETGVFLCDCRWDIAISNR
jgi:hypothetical protein